MADRYLVTGAAGFVGANLVARLKSQGHFVRATDIKHTPHREHLYSRANEFWRMDLRDPDAAHKLCHGVSHVYHLAADHGGMGYLVGATDFKVARNNLLIDQNLLAGAIAQDVTRLFFSSSACGYPVDIQDRDGVALSETDWGRAPAQGLYGEAKRLSTLMFEGARENGLLDARCAIFHQLYGPTQDWQEPRAKFPPAICRKMLEDSARVEIWGDGSQIRTFIFIQDALDRIETLMCEPYHGPVNLGSDEVVTVQQCAEWVAEIAGAEPEWVHVDRPTGVMYRTCDNTLWNERYGESTFTAVKDGFAATYRWLRDEGHVTAAAAAAAAAVG
jgi:nucleoside-diphosphate-sugar epimerase